MKRSQELYYAIAAGGEEAALRDLRVKVGEGVAGWVVQHGETLIVPEAEHDPRMKQGARRQAAVSALGHRPALARAQRNARRRSKSSTRAPTR